MAALAVAARLSEFAALIAASRVTAFIQTLPVDTLLSGGVSPTAALIQYDISIARTVSVRDAARNAGVGVRRATLTTRTAYRAICKKLRALNAGGIAYAWFATAPAVCQDDAAEHQ
jgi:hypothetical protein